jgi:hypothetical protein
VLPVVLVAVVVHYPKIVLVQLVVVHFGNHLVAAVRLGMVDLGLRFESVHLTFGCR